MSEHIFHAPQPDLGMLYEQHTSFSDSADNLDNLVNLDILAGDL